MWAPCWWCAVHHTAGHRGSGRYGVVPSVFQPELVEMHHGTAVTAVPLLRVHVLHQEVSFEMFQHRLLHLPRAHPVHHEQSLQRSYPTSA
jgi:hypothetical protein